MALSPALCLRLRVAGGGRRALGGGRLSGCLFVYGPRKLYWFYTPACFEIKERFQGGGGGRPPGAQRTALFIFWSLVEHSLVVRGLLWGWTAGLGASPGTGRALKAQGDSLSSMSFWQAGEDPELGGRGLWFPQSPKRALLKHVTGALAKSRLASSLSFGDLVFQRGRRVMTPAPHPRGTR